MLQCRLRINRGREKKKKEIKREREWNRKNGCKNRICTLNHAYQPVFFFTCIVKTLTNGCFFFFFINKMYYDKTSCCFPRSILFQLLSRPCNCYHHGII